MINIDCSKIMLFSDIHWGKSRDSVIKLEQNDMFIDWMIEQALEHKVKTIVFMGDWFDNRNSVSVKTYFHSYKAIKRMVAADLEVYLFVGNHDSYFKNTIEVNSLTPLNELDGVHIVNELEDVHFTKSDTLAGFLPWDTFNYEELKDKQYDAMFGHFEFKGALFTASGSLTCNHGYSISEMTKAAPIVYTGHFHARKEYHTKHGKVVCVGCPLELDWGDYENAKGIHIVDTKTFDYEFIENTVNSRHIKIFWSQLKTKQIKLDLSVVKNNFVKVIIDTEYKFANIMKVVNAINMKGPLKPCETEFIYNANFNFFEGNDEKQDYEFVHKSKIEHLISFIEKTPEDKMNGINLHKAINLAKNYYEEANKRVADE